MLQDRGPRCQMLAIFAQLSLLVRVDQHSADIREDGRFIPVGGIAAAKGQSDTGVEAA